MGRRRPLEERFWSKVKRRGPDECWLWQGALNGGGYGSLSQGGRGGKTLKAHRVSYTLDSGRPLTPSTEIHHSCRRPDCVNPRHLYAIEADDHRELHHLRSPEWYVGTMALELLRAGASNHVIGASIRRMMNGR